MTDRISVCLFTSATYAAPTAAVAAQIAGYQDPAIAGIYYVWAEPAAPPTELSRFLAARNIKLVAMPDTLLIQLDGLGSGRLPGAAFARMLLAQVLAGENIDRFVYLDGDVDVRLPIGALAEIAMPEGFIATADGYQDVISTQTAERRVRWNAQMAKLGLAPGDKYFNNGVIVSHMATWEKLGPETLDFFVKNRDICPFLDQDALNALCRERRVVLSPRYNFQRAYFPAGVFEEVNPCIIHFHGELKPWAPTPFVWTWGSRKPFADTFAALPELWKRTPPRNKTVGQKLAMHVDGMVRALGERGKRNAFQKEFREYMATRHFVDYHRGAV